MALEAVNQGLRTKFAKALGICRTRLYRTATKQQERDLENINQLRDAHTKEPYYGVERLAIMLGWSQKKTRRIRNLANITARRHKRHAKSVRKSEIAVPENLLRPYYALIDEARPEKGYTFSGLTDPTLSIWVQDFTYIWWHGRFYYLACVKELATRRIVGWCLSQHHNADLVCLALTDALRHYPPPAILHDDRGSEYLSLKHQKLCVRHKIAMSASAAGKPPENGFMESFFSSFKNEVSDQIASCNSELEFYECIANWIYYYNHTRIHTVLKMSPASYASILSANWGTD